MWQINQSCHKMGTSVPLYGVIGYHVTIWEGHMIANHPI